MCGGHHVALRGVASAVGVLVVEVQPSLVEVRLDVLRDGLAVIPLDALDQYRLAALEVGTLLAGKLHVPYLGRYLELLALVEAVRGARVAQTARFEVRLDERGEFLAPAVHHAVEEDGPPFTQLFLLLGSDFHAVDLVRNVDFPCAFRGVGVVAGVGRAACRLVELHVGGEQFPVLALHALHEDGLAPVQVVDLLLGQFHASQVLPVEELVVLEDELHAPALGIDLDVGVERVARSGCHSFYEYFLSFT